MKTLRRMILITIIFLVVLNIYVINNIDASYTLNKDIKSQIYKNIDNYVEYEDIPKNLIDAIISVEDKRYLNHFGFDLIGIGRATVENIKEQRYAEGGSTITQQLAKNIFLTNDKNLTRKLKELVLAIDLEILYTKEDILEMYLNVIYYGEGAYGIQDAAKTYFDKDVEELTLAECSMIAGLPKAPSIYNPIKNPDKAKERQKIVLTIMTENNLISSEKLQMIVN